MIRRIPRLDAITQHDFIAMGAETAPLLIDVDNTLLGPTSQTVDPNLKAWVESMATKHSILLCTNNFTSRQANVGPALKQPILMRSFKPFPFRIRQELKRRNIDPKTVVILGDQVVTDVWLAKWLNRPYCLIKPMAKDRHWVTRVLRILESLVISDE